LILHEFMIKYSSIKIKVYLFDIVILFLLYL